jgi:adenosylmethionine-8-amino-7-oxononanoate aminotransferase
VADRETKQPFEPEAGLAGRIKARAFENGLICYPAGGTADGISGDHILLAPPFIISEDELTLLIDLIDKSINQAIADAGA